MTASKRLQENSRSHGKFWAGCVVGVIVGAVALGAVVADRLTPEPVAGPTEAPVVLPVTQTQQAGSTSVAVTVKYSEPRVATSQASGTVTEVDVSPGDKIVDGAVLARVNGRPLMAMVSPSPLFRDLQASDSGSDVAVLQTWLTNRGFFTGTVNGQFNAATTAAVKAWQGSVGEKATGLCEVALFSWVGSTEFVVSDVRLTAGQIVDPGAEAFASAPTATSVEVVEPPGGIKQVGDQVLAVGGASVPYILGSGSVTAAENVAALTEAIGPTGQGLGRVTAKNPTTVKMLPSSAIVTDAEGRTCVFESTDSPPVAVSPVGGGLGSVTVSDDFSLSQVLANPTQTRTDLSCS